MDQILPCVFGLGCHCSYSVVLLHVRCELCIILHYWFRISYRHWLSAVSAVFQCSVRITWKPEYAGPPQLFSLPHRAHAVAENLGTEGPHTYFSVIRLLFQWSPIAAAAEVCFRVRYAPVPFVTLSLKPRTHDKQMLANKCWTTVWRRWPTQQTTTTLLQQWFL